MDGGGGTDQPGDSVDTSQPGDDAGTDQPDDDVVGDYGSGNTAVAAAAGVEATTPGVVATTPGVAAVRSPHLRLRCRPCRRRP